MRRRMNEVNLDHAASILEVGELLEGACPSVSKERWSIGRVLGGEDVGGDKVLEALRDKAEHAVSRSLRSERREKPPCLEDVELRDEEQERRGGAARERSAEGRGSCRRRGKNEKVERKRRGGKEEEVRRGGVGGEEEVDLTLSFDILSSFIFLVTCFARSLKAFLSIDSNTPGLIDLAMACEYVSMRLKIIHD